MKRQINARQITKKKSTPSICAHFKSYEYRYEKRYETKLKIKKNRKNLTQKGSTSGISFMVKNII